MPGRSAPEAGRALLRDLQHVVACVTDAVLYASGHRPDGRLEAIQFRDGPFVTLRGGANFRLKFRHHFRLVHQERRRWEAETAGYIYELHRAGERIFGYHWHQEDDPAWEHVHVDAQKRPSDGRDIHFPTGRVSLAMMLRVVIDDFGVEVVTRHQHRWRAIREMLDQRRKASP